MSLDRLLCCLRQAGEHLGGYSTRKTARGGIKPNPVARRNLQAEIVISIVNPGPGGILDEYKPAWMCPPSRSICRRPRHPEGGPGFKRRCDLCRLVVGDVHCVARRRDDYPPNPIGSCGGSAQPGNEERLRRSRCGYVHGGRLEVIPRWRVASSQYCHGEQKDCNVVAHSDEAFSALGQARRTPEQR